MRAAVVGHVEWVKFLRVNRPPIPGSVMTATEAWEEAGVTGDASNLALGFYSYNKPFEDDTLPIVVAMFPLRVRRVLKEWPERAERKRKWVGRKKAAALLQEPGLQQMVRSFDPRHIGH